MKNLFTYKNNLNFTFLPLLALFILISNVIDNNIREFSFIEVISNFILLICIFFQIKNRKLFLKLSNLISFLIRLFIYTFLFYEEISFFTQYKSTLFNEISSQSEINLHNLSFLFDKHIDIYISFVNYPIVINLYMLIITVMLFIIGYGSYFPFMNRFKFVFLEKEYAIYTFIFAINILLNYISRKLFNSSLIFLNHELCELFIYIILLGDIFLKKKIFKNYLLGKS